MDSKNCTKCKELKPCPFCGGSVGYYEVDCGSFDYIGCDDYECLGAEIAYFDRRSSTEKAEVTKQWNKRDQSEVDNLLSVKLKKQRENCLEAIVNVCSSVGSVSDKFREAILNAPQPTGIRDNCEVCKGSKGGVKGNENIINGKLVCDYCHDQP